MNEFNRLRRNILLNSGGFPAGYEWATDADFSGTANGTFKYIGTKQYVAIPHTIKGINVTSYYDMFRGTSIKGVYSDNMNITRMDNMFRDTTSTSLDLTYLNTSSVTNMEGMFFTSKATSLDLSSFNTSRVTTMGSMFYQTLATSLNLSSFNTSRVINMYNMFRLSKATLLDLSSFDTSRVADTTYMFNRALATTGYARTQTDANKFNRSSGKPSTLIFIVKPQ